MTIKKKAREKPARPPGDSQLYSTAIHEAGHLVLALRLGLHVDEVSIVPRGRIAGYVSLFHDDLAREAREAQGPEAWFRAKLLMHLAGPAAEGLHCGGFDAKASSSDFARAREMIKHLSVVGDSFPRSMSRRQLDDYVSGYYHHVVVPMLSDAACWQQVVEVADRLMIDRKLRFDRSSWINDQILAQQTPRCR